MGLGLGEYHQNPRMLYALLLKLLASMGKETGGVTIGIDTPFPSQQILEAFIKVYTKSKHHFDTLTQISF